MMQERDPKKHIASVMASWAVVLFRLIHVKSKMRRGCLPTWGITTTGDINNLGRPVTADRGNKTKYPA